MTETCESCGMPIETGRYCAHCVDEDGRLQSFEDRFERMVAWQQRRQPQATRAELETATKAYMATMPAWRDHPAIRAYPHAPAGYRASADPGLTTPDS